MDVTDFSDHGKLKRSAAVFLFFVRRYPARSLLMCSALVLSGVAEGLSITLFLPLIQRITDGGAGAGGRMGDWIFGFFRLLGMTPTLLGLLVVIVLGLALKGGLFWVAMSQVGYTIARVATDLRIDLINALLRARWAHFISQPTGRFANAISSEAIVASGAYLNASQSIACLVQLAVYILLAFLLSWPTALAGLCAGLLFIVLMRKLIEVSRAMGKRKVHLTRSVTGRIVDMLHGLKPVKAMAREGTLLHFMEVEAEELNTAQRRQVRANVTVAVSQEPIMVLIMASGLYVIHMHQLMPFSALLVQAFLFSRLFTQVNHLVQAYQRFVANESALISIRHLTEEIMAYQESESGQPAPSPLQKGIFFRGVAFAYGDTTVLNALDIEIPARTWTALVGPSGAGKTTISDLVSGLYTPQGETFTWTTFP